MYRYVLRDAVVCRPHGPAVVPDAVDTKVNDAFENVALTCRVVRLIVRQFKHFLDVLANAGTINAACN